MIKLVASKVGELAVWRMANFEDGGMWRVESADEAIRLINALADLDLANRQIADNSFGLMEWDGTEWSEWYHPDTGDDIDQYGELIADGDV